MASHSNRQWQGKFFKCGMRCWYCFKALSLLPGESVELATKDHLIPTSRGGSESIDNIAPACFACNRKKGDMTEQEFRRKLSTAFDIVCKGVPAAETYLPLEQRDERALHVIRRESESISWAWRNPA
jgi:CRISPR/Cas system Type II protein with McrA/HNH and RuvC-like nuclease domain